jgi:hypothetical protein
VKLSLWIVALGAVLAALVSCGGSQLPGSPAAATRAARSGGTWMSPQARHQNLLYVSDSGTRSVDAIGYRSGKLLGVLTGFSAPAGECVDGKGDIFIADTVAGSVYEYARGGTTLLNTLSGLHNPMACSVDPKSSALAVVYETGLAVYQNASGTPALYPICTGSCIDYSDSLGVAYDNRGNLFVHYQYYVGTGSQGYDVFAIYQLVGAEFTRVFDWGNCEGCIGTLAWDGKNLALGLGNGTIIRVAENGWHEVGEIHIPGGGWPAFSVYRNRLVWPLGFEGGVDLYTYPGGAFRRSFTGIETSFAAVVDPAGGHHGSTASAVGSNFDGAIVRNGMVSPTR